MNALSLIDAQVLAVIEKQIKQRKESIKAFSSAGRDDLASKEQAEVALFLNSLPAAMTEEELIPSLTKRLLLKKLLA